MVLEVLFGIFILITLAMGVGLFLTQRSMFEKLLEENDRFATEVLSPTVDKFSDLRDITVDNQRSITQAFNGMRQLQVQFQMTHSQEIQFIERMRVLASELNNGVDVRNLKQCEKVIIENCKAPEV